MQNFVTVQLWIPYTWKFSPGEKFHHLLLLAKFLSRLSCVNDYHRGYGDLNRVGKNLFHQIFLQYKGSWAWQNICQAKISTYKVIITPSVATTYIIWVYLPFPRSSLGHGRALKCVSLAGANKHHLFWKHLSVDGTAKVDKTHPLPSESTKIELLLIQKWPTLQKFDNIYLVCEYYTIIPSFQYSMQKSRRQ